MKRWLGRRKWCPIIVCNLVLFFFFVYLARWKFYNVDMVENHYRVPKWASPSNPAPWEMASLDSNLLLVLVHSSVKRSDRRDAIRATWLADYQQSTESSPVRYRFILGGADLSPHVSEQLKDESEKHNDIIVLPSNPDNALKLTQRTIESFKISVQKLSFSYLLKCDEDTYADVPRLATELQQRQENPTKRLKPLYWGELLTWKIYSDGLYGEKEFTVCDRYLPYALGGGYILSRNLVELLVNLSPYLRGYVSEDVSVGAWLVPYNIEYCHDMRFDTGAKSRGCKDPYLITHKVNVDQMYSNHMVYKSDGTFCSSKNRQIGALGHKYEWTKLPSHSMSYAQNNP